MDVVKNQNMDQFLETGEQIKKLLEQHIGREIQSYSMSYDQNKGTMEIKVHPVAAFTKIEHTITIMRTGDISDFE